MTVGDIKVETLKLMEINDTDVSVETLEDFEQDENYKEYFSRMSGSINRAINRIKTAGAVPEKSYTETVSENTGILRYNISEKISDFSKLKRVVLEMKNTYISNYPYTFEGTNIVLFNIRAGSKVTLIYEPLMPVIRTTTSNDTEIPLPDELSAIIPYFVKADVYEQDEPELATQSRNIFELMLAEYKGQEQHAEINIDSVYKQGW